MDDSRRTSPIALNKPFDAAALLASARQPESQAATDRVPKMRSPRGVLRIPSFFVAGRALFRQGPPARRGWKRLCSSRLALTDAPREPLPLVAGLPGHSKPISLRADVRGRSTIAIRGAFMTLSRHCFVLLGGAALRAGDFRRLGPTSRRYWGVSRTGRLQNGGRGRRVCYALSKSPSSPSLGSSSRDAPYFLINDLARRKKMRRAEPEIVPGLCVTRRPAKSPPRSARTNPAFHQKNDEGPVAPGWEAQGRRSASDRCHKAASQRP